MYFEYGEKEIEYLKSKDKRLGEVIDKIGQVNFISQLKAQKLSAIPAVWQKYRLKKYGVLRYD